MMMDYKCNNNECENRMHKIDELNKEIHSIKFRQLESKIKNEKILKEFLIAIKDFFIQTSHFGFNQNANFAASPSFNNASVPLFNSGLLDIFSKSFKTLFNFNVHNLNYSIAETVFINDLIKELDQTLEKLKAKICSSNKSSTKSTQTLDFSTVQPPKPSLNYFEIDKLNLELKETSFQVLSLKQKLKDQQRLIDTLMTSFKTDNYINTASTNSNMTNVTPMSSLSANIRYRLYSLSNDVAVSATSSSAPSTPTVTSTSSSLLSSPSYLVSDFYEHVMSKESDREYSCPKCHVVISSDQIMYKIYQSHVKKCDLKLNQACMFCFKLYGLTEQLAFENHVRKHVKNSYKLEISPTTTVDTSNEHDQDINHNNNVTIANKKSGPNIFISYNN